MPLKFSKAPAKTKVQQIDVAHGKDSSGKPIKKETLVKDVPGQVADHPGNASPVEGTPCVVSYSVGSTHSTGEYEGIKFHVGISVPCKHDELDGVFDFAKTWAEGKLNETVADTLGNKE